MRKVLLSFFVVIVFSSAMAQVKWPAITNQTKPWTRWWWLGSQVKKNDLTTVMQQYQQVGLGGLEITPIYGVQKEEEQYIPFLSKEWMEVFSHTLKEGKRLNLGIDLANATGWPFGGPWIGDEDACKNMQVKMYSLNGGETLQDTIQFIQEPLVRTENYKPVKIEDVLQPISANKNLQALSMDQVRFVRPLPLQTLMAYSDAGESIDLTNKVDTKGKLNWTAPNGKWNLYALFMGWHGKQVERAAPGGEGNVIDHFSASALQHYLKRFDDAFKNTDISSLRGFFNDSYEVDDARGQSNYTPLLFEEFKKRRGYDLKTELPALFTKTHTDRTNRILCDYRMTIDELILEDFTGEWKKWAHSKGKIVRNQSHGSPANTLDLYGVVDIPETEGTEILRIKFAPSTSHVMGKPLAASESATWLNEHFVSSLSDVKKALDVYFIGGVNHIVYHGTSYSPPSEPWPGRLFYAAVEFTQANPFWNNFSALNSYVTKTQSFLQQGKPDNDVLLYFPIYDKYSEPGRDLLLHFDGMKPDFNGTPFETSATMMQEKGYAFDYISDRQILNLQTANNKIITGGTAYQTIVLPDAKFMKVETLKHLMELAKNGATIIAYKNLPSDVPGYGQLEKNTAAFKNLLSQLKFGNTDFEEVKSATIGKGRFLTGDNLESLLHLAAIRKETMVDKGLQFSRRKNADGSTFYFVANRSNKKIDDFIPLQIKASGAALYNPMNGAAGIAETSNGDNFITVRIQLNPDESYIVQTSAKRINGVKYPYIEETAAPVEITGEWQLQFKEGGPTLPPSVTLSEGLLPWTDAKAESYKTFSGSASYSTHFKKPSGTATKYLLDLGKVYESAEVFMNGRKIATLIGPAYSTVINAKDLKADNTIEIKVANSMANRIIDLDKRKVVWKKFNNTNFPARLATNRGADGLFDASKWEPKISGLAGPVTLTAIK
ncbi:glycosyl hydrolase [Ferruginibacter sp. SUN106]|uniref:glycosyl hydrolase n=1 Tax=Ferruginibacter sp. SUN106 TaxID=2978348 RepID=UPI003D367AF1